MSLELTKYKTEVLLISTMKTEVRILLTIAEITSQPQLKYLEVILDSKLKFKEHRAHTSSKAKKKSMGFRQDKLTIHMQQ